MQCWKKILACTFCSCYTDLFIYWVEMLTNNQVVPVIKIILHLHNDVFNLIQRTKGVPSFVTKNTADKVT